MEKGKKVRDFKKIIFFISKYLYPLYYMNVIC